MKNFGFSKSLMVGFMLLIGASSALLSTKIF